MGLFKQSTAVNWMLSGYLSVDDDTSQLTPEDISFPFLCL